MQLKYDAFNYNNAIPFKENKTRTQNVTKTLINLSFMNLKKKFKK